MSSDFTLRDPDAEELASFSAVFGWFNDILVRGFNTEIRLNATVADLPTLNSLLDAGPYGDDIIGELEMFGTAFGQILTTELGLKWVVYRDREGASFALQYPGRNIFLFPVDMIVKRIRSGQDVRTIDLTAILEELRQTVQQELAAQQNA